MGQRDLALCQNHPVMRRCDLASHQNHPGIGQRDLALPQNRPGMGHCDLALRRNHPTIVFSIRTLPLLQGKSPKGDGYNIKNIVFKALRPCKTPKTSFLRFCDLATCQKHRFWDFSTLQNVKNIVFETLHLATRQKRRFRDFATPQCAKNIVFETLRTSLCTL